MTEQPGLNKLYTRIEQELSKVIVGQEEHVKELMFCLLCGGHVLIEGLPGLGKTLLVKSFGRVMDLNYSRIQFTPDLMPADILGTNVINEPEPGKREFKFYKGPVFGQIILADEINRATPKTQSALLEAMQEGHVTMFGKKYTLDKPFIVLATQNPIEMEGTYPLPEAQIDRFMFKLLIDYPKEAALLKILDKATGGDLPQLTPVLDAVKIQELKSQIGKVPTASHVKTFATRILMGTHPDNETADQAVKTFVRYGASPRGVLAMVQAARARALLEGRYNVALEDIKSVAKPALRHRIILNLKGIAEGIDPDSIIDGIIQSV